MNENDNETLKNEKSINKTPKSKHERVSYISNNGGSRRRALNNIPCRKHSLLNSSSLNLSTSPISPHKRSIFSFLYDEQNHNKNRNNYNDNELNDLMKNEYLTQSNNLLQPVAVNLFIFYKKRVFAVFLRFWF